MYSTCIQFAIDCTNSQGGDRPRFQNVPGLIVECHTYIHVHVRPWLEAITNPHTHTIQMQVLNWVWQWNIALALRTLWVWTFEFKTWTWTVNLKFGLNWNFEWTNDKSLFWCFSKSLSTLTTGTFRSCGPGRHNSCQHAWLVEPGQSCVST